MKFKLIISAIVFIAGQFSVCAQTIPVVTSTTDLKSIVESVGGTHVQVSSIARGDQNIHSVEVLPSYMLKIKKAKLYVKIGMGLDQWADPLIDGARNSDISILDCSKDITKLDVPAYKVDASHGDVHPYGNPHYWLDPKNGEVIAREICDELSRLSPQYRADFETNLASFKQITTSKINSWEQLMVPYKGSKVIVYHDDWRYFAEAFGFDIVGFIEPKPGLEPTPSHLYELTKIIKSQGVKVIGFQPYFSDQAPNSLASQTGATAVKLATSVGCMDEVHSYGDIFEYNLRQIISVLKQ